MSRKKPSNVEGGGRLDAFRRSHGVSAAEWASEISREIGPQAACDYVARETPGYTRSPREMNPLLDLAPIRL